MGIFNGLAPLEHWTVTVTVPESRNVQALTETFELVMLELCQSVAPGFDTRGFSHHSPEHAGCVLSAMVRVFPGTSVDSLAQSFKAKMTDRRVAYLSIVIESPRRHAAGLGNIPRPRDESVYRAKPEGAL